MLSGYSSLSLHYSQCLRLTIDVPCFLASQFIAEDALLSVLFGWQYGPVAWHVTIKSWLHHLEVVIILGIQIICSGPWFLPL